MSWLQGQRTFVVTMVVVNDIDVGRSNAVEIAIAKEEEPACTRKNDISVTKSQGQHRGGLRLTR